MSGHSFYPAECPFTQPPSPFRTLTGNGNFARRRNLGFLLILLLAAIPVRAPLISVFNLSIHDDRYTQIVVVPIISGIMIYLRRNAIFGQGKLFLPMVPPVIVFELLLFFQTAVHGGTSLSLATFVLTAIGGFALCYGKEALRNAAFPLLLLFLTVPLPTRVLDQAVATLQEGSAEVAYVLFKMAGVPVFRRGFQFSLPGVDIQIAEECSGIRSGIALFITALLAGQIFLRSGWSKISLILFVIPIAIVKNAVRIATISCLGVYVDVNFLYGRLHRYGGIPFSLLALAIFMPLVFGLYKLESRRRIEG